jgi:hypothetical protein
VVPKELRLRLGAVVDPADDALLMLELVYGVLELPSQDAPIGDHDDRVEHLGVARVGEGIG